MPNDTEQINDSIFDNMFDHANLIHFCSGTAFQLNFIIFDIRLNISFNFSFIVSMCVRIFLQMFSFNQQYYTHCILACAEPS